jgi:AcrR family transcriptional regulator
MTRTKDLAIRALLLEKAVAYILEHGLSDLSLRPLADAIGSSARMLIHHFGSKETLLAEILAVIEGQFLALFAAESGGDDPVKGLERFWKTVTSGQTDHVQRLVFEVWGQALTRPEGFESFLSSLTEPFTAQLERAFKSYGVPKAKRETLAALTISTFYGLLLMRLTARQDYTVEAAFKQFSRWLRAELEASRGQV